jgi:hypothetical protein
MSQIQCPNPYKPGDCAGLNEVIRITSENLELCAKGQRCGFPVEEFEETNRRLLKMAQDAKREFFPLQS